MKWKEILRKDKYALLQSESDTQYCVASGYDPTQPEDQQWASGTYFTYWNNTERKAICLQNALDLFTKCIGLFQRQNGSLTVGSRIYAWDGDSSWRAVCSAAATTE